jgi:hypothetical protein
VETLLNDLRKFLDEQRNEIIVVEVSHLLGKPSAIQKAKLVHHHSILTRPTNRPTDQPTNRPIPSLLLCRHTIVHSRRVCDV